ncbi:LOW QUALITY PROTEIN: cilia- and flagella-associated protein 100 [Pholidichthys leucotaenia]
MAKEERQLEELEKMTEQNNLSFEAFLRENEDKSVEAGTLSEHDAKSVQEKNKEIERLTAEAGVIKGDLFKLEENLGAYKRYKNFLFKLSPPEWQEAQRAKILKAQAEKGDSQEMESITDRQDARLTSAHSHDLVIFQNSLEYEPEPQLCFSDPQELVDLMTELTEQNLSLIQNSTRVEETLKERTREVETAKKKTEKDEKQIMLQISDIKLRIEWEKTKRAKLEEKVLTLSQYKQDVMLDGLSEKVAEVHSSCVDDRMTDLATLEKLANTENRLWLLLQATESIPEEKLELMWKIKVNVRRARQREEKLREQQEIQKGKMRRYLERSLADSKKISVRKLMPRSMAVAQRVKVTSMDNKPVEVESPDKSSASQENFDIFNCTV